MMRNWKKIEKVFVGFWFAGWIMAKMRKLAGDIAFKGGKEA